MSDISNHSTDTNRLIQRLQSAEKSIEFIQHEHASTLTHLHDEISKWQQKCSELTFQLAIGGNIINSIDDHKNRSKIEQLENEIHQCKETIKKLNKILEEKDRHIIDYENRIVVNERKHASDLRLEQDKQRQLKIELEQRSTLIAQLTTQLHRDRLRQIILPNKPPKLENKSDERQKSGSVKHLFNRSSSLSNRASPDQRRPPTPPQQLRSFSPKNNLSNDEQMYTKRQLQLLNTHPQENNDMNLSTSLRPLTKLSPILPPIVNRKIPLVALPTAPLRQKNEA